MRLISLENKSSRSHNMKTWKLADTLKHSMGSTHRTNAKWDKEFHMQ